MKIEHKQNTIDSTQPVLCVFLEALMALVERVTIKCDQIASVNMSVVRNCKSFSVRIETDVFDFEVVDRRERK